MVIKMKFYECPKCGNIVEILDEQTTNLNCCDENMVLMTANIKDAAKEKHNPEIQKNDNIISISVGSIIHPMEENHYIKWIYILTNKRNIRYNLQPGENPSTKLTLEPQETILEVYAYCNNHGLWLNNK